MAFSAMFTSSLQSFPISGGKTRPIYCSPRASSPAAILHSISRKIPLGSLKSSFFQDGLSLKSSIVSGFSSNSQNSSVKSRNSSGKVYATAATEKTIYDYTVKKVPFWSLSFAIGDDCSGFGTDIDGKDVPLSKFKGKVLLIVNVASKCGLTNSNYTELSHVYEKYKPQGFEILAFPCNQFGGQEPGSNTEIKNFACTRFKAEFPIFDKVDVNGPNAAPVYQFLKSSSGGFLGDMIKWNFEKFLVDRNGKVVGRYPPTTSPLQIEKDIQKLVAA